MKTRAMLVLAMVAALAMSMLGAALASPTVTVTEDDLVTDAADLEGGTWPSNVIGDDSGPVFDEGFGAPEGLGDGALRLFTEDDSDARAGLGTVVEVPLDEVGSLSYWTYQPAGNPDNAAVAYKMYVTFDGG